MRLIQNKIFFLTLFIIGVVHAQPTKAYYILAKNGLSLRNTASLKSERLFTIKYGEKVYVEDLEKDTSSKKNWLKADNISGVMVKVNYNNKEGYVFDGYLTDIAPPRVEEKVSDYVERARPSSPGKIVLFETITRDYDGYYLREETIFLKTDRWSEAFLLAKRLFNIPEKLGFPNLDFEGETLIITNPDKKEYSWSDELEVTRKNEENDFVITYTIRSEGGGMSVKLEKDDNGESIRISRTGIAD
ncbi:SH3 domain-containing protein [Aquimarina algiphila]|uniref:SH3 domain-containing protein n=1 Tax=Aquimarina algiphila TaxID=2047982 RepID=A0A554VNE1_9FLAO|nr:SH3 domain-containing protein [Aquimarina algiphila]TSE09862.1 SH3 domain-containing protein [Aquimarina algiphila]